MQLDQNLTAEKLIDLAKQNGAEDVDISINETVSQSSQIRLSKLESSEISETVSISLRVFINNKTSIISSTRFDDESLKSICKKGVDMAKATPENPYSRLAKKTEQAKIFPKIELYDKKELSNKELEDLALECEDSALEVNGITNTDGSSANSTKSFTTVATSNGFFRQYKKSNFSFSVVVLAKKNGEMQRDFDYSNSVFFSDLKNPSIVGKNASERTLSKLGSKKPNSGKFSIIFNKRISNSIVSHISNAINGNSIARGTSFLKNSLNKKITSSSIKLIDDPLINRALGSKFFDGESLPVQKRTLIKEGVLMGWLLDLSTSIQLKMPPTGNALRFSSSPPSPGPSNIYIENGTTKLDDFVSSIKNGFYVTELIGNSVNLTNGDYSRGASGFWIENGKISFPVSEVTIAGNLNEIFQSLEPANDLKIDKVISSPSLFVKEMTVAGN